MKRYVITAGLACALALPSYAVAQSSAQPPAKPQTTKPETTKPQPPATGGSKSASQSASASGVAASDQAFAKEAAIGGLAEVDLGKLAASKASSSDVKQFGQRMVDDHGKANDELKSWASQKNVTLPTELDAKHKSEHARLEKLSGEAFDHAYMTSMVQDHNKDVAAFQRESQSGKDADLKAWAAKTLPTLQDHQKSAKEIASKVQGGAKTGAPKSAPKTGAPKNPGK
jgi:putative membrane protein